MPHSQNHKIKPVPKTKKWLFKKCYYGTYRCVRDRIRVEMRIKNSTGSGSSGWFVTIARSRWYSFLSPEQKRYQASNLLPLCKDDNYTDSFNKLLHATFLIKTYGRICRLSTCQYLCGWLYI